MKTLIAFFALLTVAGCLTGTEPMSTQSTQTSNTRTYVGTDASYYGPRGDPFATLQQSDSVTIDAIHRDTSFGFANGTTIHSDYIFVIHYDSTVLEAYRDIDTSLWGRLRCFYILVNSLTGPFPRYLSGSFTLDDHHFRVVDSMYAPGPPLGAQNRWWSEVISATR